jgi:hypothetical protein
MLLAFYCSNSLILNSSYFSQQAQPSMSLMKWTDVHSRRP